MKTLLTTIVLSTSLAVTAVMASPKFEGRNMGSMNSADRIQLITDRMTEQGMSADEIQSKIETIQTRIESQNGRMQNQEAMQERVVEMQSRMSEQGFNQQDRLQKMEQMRSQGDHSQAMDHEKRSSLSEEQRIAKITERMSENGYSQDEIDAKITEINAIRNQ